MSEWTHVAATFRFDFAPIDDDGSLEAFVDRVIGRRIPEPPDAWPHDGDAYEKWERVAMPMSDERAQHPERFVPYGSEGGLTVSVHPMHDRSLASNLAVSCFGDLRDFGDALGGCGNMGTLRRWFRHVIRESIDPTGGQRPVHVRQAVLTAADEGVGTLTMTFDNALGGRFLGDDGNWSASFPDKAFPEYPDAEYAAFLRQHPEASSRILPVPVDAETLAARKRELDSVLAEL